MQIGQRSPCPVQTGSAWELIFFVLRKKAKTHKKKKKEKKKKEAKESSNSSKGVSSVPKSKDPFVTTG